MKKLLNFKIAFMLIVISFAIFSGIKGYRYATNLTNLPAFLLENAEALAEGEGTEGLKLWCETSKGGCSYRCPSCNRLVEYGNQKTLIAVTGVCNRCGHPAN